MTWGNGMGGWGMLLMTMGNLLFWGLVIAGLVLLVRYAGSRVHATTAPIGQRLTPHQVLAERFARGDIDEKEYIQRLRVLDGAASTRRPER